MAALRNKREDVIRAVTQNGGMMGFSLYPHHLKDKSDCSVQGFCEMIARTGEKYGIEHFGIGSDLCQDQPDSVVERMRVGRWTKEIDYGEGSAANPGFPPMPRWFQDNRDFDAIEEGLRAVGMNAVEVAGILAGLLLTVHGLALVGATAAALSFLIGRIAGNLYLIPPCLRWMRAR